jgi:hypothetical protein
MKAQGVEATFSDRQTASIQTVSTNAETLYCSYYTTPTSHLLWHPQKEMLLAGELGKDSWVVGNEIFTGFGWSEITREKHFW